MSKDLYFIKILCDALGDPNPKNALHRAFSNINALGQEPEYAVGYEQFMQFMSMVKSNSESGEEFIDPELLRRHLEQWMIQVGLSESLPGIEVECDGEVVGKMKVAKNGSIGSVPGLKPGSYRVCLETGWVLWQGELGKADLIWRHAFPEETLSLAAETDGVIVRSSREIVLLEGELTLRLMPGRTSGRMDFIFSG